MKLASGEFAKQASMGRFMSRYADELAQAAGSPAARAVRADMINPLLREQGEFMAGTGQGLSDLLAEYIPALAPRLTKQPLSDAAVSMGTGGLGGLLAGRLLYGDLEEGL